MPITVIESPESQSAEIYRDGIVRSISLVYHVYGTVDLLQATAAVRQRAPLTLYGIQRGRPQMESRDDGAGYDVTIVYDREDVEAQEEQQQEQPQPGQVWPGTSGEISFTNVTLTQAIRTKAHKVAQGLSLADWDTKGAIGYDGEQVNGTEIAVPVFTWNETHTFASNQVTISYMTGLESLSETPVNAGAFRSRAAGEVRWNGCSFNRAEDGESWSFTFQFQTIKNNPSVRIGLIPPVSKDGWDFLDVQYKDDVSGKRKTKRPASVAVQEVYRRGNFSLLGIGS